MAKPMFDFDAVISREGTSAEKYTARQRLFGRDDVMPFWVADMEFAVAPAIQEALADRVRHPVYGYTSVSEDVIAAITAWNKNRYSLNIDNESVVLVPGVMAGISAAIYSLSDPGDGVVVQPPVYPPLLHTVSKTGRRLLRNPLVSTDGSYQIDFAELDRLCQANRPRMLLLCSPHNPVGRVWTGEELARLVDIADRHKMFLVSDEIHADIMYAPLRFVSALSVGQEAPDRIIVLNSASKSFNVAGLNTAYAIIPEKKMRSAFRQKLRGMNLHGVNLFGLTALEAAYRHGAEWLDELLRYLQGNRDYMRDRLAEGLPGLRQFLPQGTYLYWLDFNSLGLAPVAIRRQLIDDAGLGLNDGITFSHAHEGFWRFNFAVPRTMLDQGLTRLIRAF